MATDETNNVWAKIIEALEEKLQYGFLEHARSVVKATLKNSELHLVVAHREAEEFFNSSVHQQRLMLLCRGVVYFDQVTVDYVEAEPIPR